MRRAIVLMAWVLAAGTAHADDAGSCYSIASPDARAWCLAKAHADPGRCYSIQDSAMRSMCLAEVRR